MSDAPQRWDGWHARLSAVATVFTRPGGVRLGPWVTGMVLGWEEPTRTQMLTALGLEARWRVLEPCAAYGAWDRDAVERLTRRVIEQEWPARWGGYHPVAGDDTPWHRTRAKGWGTGPFHACSARSPTRAETGRAPNWVVLGDLVPGPPWTSLPQAARLSGRQKPVPAGERFQTKTAWAVEVWRQADDASAAPILGGWDGADAVATVVDPCRHPQPGQRRIAILTRRRADARR